MTEPLSNPSPRPSAGCVVIAIDESKELEARVAGGTKSKAESLATAVNSLLAQLAAVPGLDVAIVGYRGDGQGGADVGCRWAGPLAGRRMVRSDELAANPLTVESRVRRVPAPGTGTFREETVAFPVWYVPTLGMNIASLLGYGYCHHLLTAWVAESVCDKPPLMVSVIETGMPKRASVDRVLAVPTPQGPALLLHAHLGGQTGGRPVLYPSTETFLPPDGSRELFHGSGVLPPFMVAALRRAQVTLNADARGMVFNATLGDLIRFFSLVKEYAQFGAGVPGILPASRGADCQSAEARQVGNLPHGAVDVPGMLPVPQPGPAGATGILPVPQPGTTGATGILPVPGGADFQSAEARQVGNLPHGAVDVPGMLPVPQPGTTGATGILPVPGGADFQSAEARQVGNLPHETDAAALVVLLADRSVSDPNDAEQAKIWARLQEHVNDLLNFVAKRGKRQVEAALLSYGAMPDGSVDFRTMFEGPLAGRAVANGEELAAGPIRIVETTEKISNGIGGLISFNRKKPIYLDVGPLAGIPASPAYQAVAGLVADWRQRHPASPCPPVVVHLTRGQFDPDELQPGAEMLGQSGARLYYLIVTQSPHRPLAYPNTAEKIDDAVLRRAWEWCGPLLGSQRLAAEKPNVAADARGFVVNAKFDLLMDGILDAIGAAHAT
jgi:hypothetical protein